MTVNSSLLAYEDCFAVMDATLADDLGLKMTMADERSAIHFRLRCHYARKLDREKNLRIYPKEDLRHGLSQYDKIVIKLRAVDGKAILLFERVVSIPGKIESLSGAEVNLTLPDYIPQKALPKPEESPLPVNEDLGDAFDQIVPVQEVLPPEPKPGIRRI